jgi:hypothetical protein
VSAETSSLGNFSGVALQSSHVYEHPTQASQFFTVCLPMIRDGQ